jgi:glycerol-3-phosphate acyltransferase PlsY
VSIVDIAWRFAAAVAFGYLLAGIPFGVIVAKRFYGADITKLGSGNTGATNIFRSLGWRAALPVALLDVAKGIVPAVVAHFLLANPAWPVGMLDLLVIVSGLAAMAGHMYSPYFRLRGGKGVATAAGAILVLMPAVFPGLLLLFVVLILTTRRVSVASLITALALPVLTWLLYASRPVLFVFACVAVPWVFWAHRSNIVRLMHGEEPRITMGSHAKGPSREDS